MIADGWILGIIVMAAVGLGIAWLGSLFVSEQFFSEHLFPWIMLGVICLAIGTCGG